MAVHESSVFFTFGNAPVVKEERKMFYKPHTSPSILGTRFVLHKTSVHVCTSRILDALRKRGALNRCTMVIVYLGI